MEVSIFKDIKHTKNPMISPVTTILERIKSGASRENIEAIRNEQDKEKRGVLKMYLKSVCFSGKFSAREDNCLIEHSGLIVLDIDDIDLNDLDSIRSILYADEYVFAGFVSPSGNGLKLLIQIPKNGAKQYAYFRALENYFNEYLKDYTSTKKNIKLVKGTEMPIDKNQGEFLRLHIDPSGKNVSRVCYESYDPDIYHNPESKLWNKEFTKEQISMEISDYDKIIEYLQKWIDKNEDYSEGNRNNYFYKFSSAMCRFGVSEDRARTYLHNLDFNFPEKELHTTIRSAYKGNQFGVEKFDVKEFNERNIEIEIPDKNVTSFWRLKKNGGADIDTKMLLKFIEAKGYYIYAGYDDLDKFDFIKIENMIVKKVGVREIKADVLKYVEKHAPEPVYDELQMKPRYFTDSFLNALPEAKINQVKDTKTTSYIFFNGFYYEITADSVKKKDYIDLKGQHIWINQICSQTITKIDEDRDDFDFTNFLFRALGQNEEKYLNFCTAIGYMVHTYKRMSITKIPYFTDENDGELDGMENGGSGKSLSCKMLKFVRNVVVIDGKDYDKKDRFKFQRVGNDTQIIILEDFEADIKDLFVKVTDGFSMNVMYHGQKYIEFDDSPKIMINSNQMPKGISDSHIRRMTITEFTDYYNSKHTPFKDFGREFFVDFTQEDWNKYYTFIFSCVAGYLRVGLKNNETYNTSFKQIKKNTNKDFVDFWKEYNSRNMNDFQMARDIISDFYREFPDSIYSKNREQTFFSWCRKLCKIYGWRYESKGVGTRREIRFAGFNFELNDFSEGEEVF